MHQHPATNQVVDLRLEHTLEEIAMDHLFIDTLCTRHSDRLDFHEVSVWGVRSALLAAYQAGVRDSAGVSD